MTVVPDCVTDEPLAYIRGGEGTVACASAPTPGSAWMVSISGGVRGSPLTLGDSVLVRGIHRLTGDPFSVPAKLLCTATGDIARFAVPFVHSSRLSRPPISLRW